MATSSSSPASAAAGWRWAMLGALIGIALALCLFAPARWLAAGLSQWSNGHLQLVNARGTVWTGTAGLCFRERRRRRRTDLAAGNARLDSAAALGRRDGGARHAVLRHQAAGASRPARSRADSNSNGATASPDGPRPCSPASVRHGTRSSSKACWKFRCRHSPCAGTAPDWQSPAMRRSMRSTSPPACRP